ncbi:MAG: glycoside hydrolase family 3 protein, partial [Phycisphaerales bacterium]|nr:glycoside hydrolase family 3 protein [Phycisphaerales bacterium]
HVGGVILFDREIATDQPRNIRSITQLEKLCKNLRHELGDHLIISVDQEGGQVARLNRRSGFSYTLSAAAFAETYKNIGPEALQGFILQKAADIGWFGINLNFAPCVDLAINPESSIIAKKDRSFSADPSLVVQCAATIIDAHRELGVRCCIKHFPGHGSARGDTHEGLVDITDTHEPKEIYPYAKLIEQYGSSLAVMTGHLVHRARDAHNPASLSRTITTGWLRDELDFTGVVITDSLDMGGAVGPGAAVRAINAGADIALNGNNTANGFDPGLIRRLHAEIHQGVEPERIYESSKRIADWIR